MLTVTREEARRFILSKQGLLGRRRFAGKEGAYQFVRQAGCIQYDPVDVCGKNAELTLQSRVKGFTRQTLADLLYRDRLLVDYSDPRGVPRCYAPLCHGDRELPPREQKQPPRKFVILLLSARIVIL